ncbi:MAG: MerR family transcriptional regulator [Verrucomicrobia bacterium]|nr:MerR family transcriptional regulator [Verrucomicrobiota bacterium]
MTGESFHVSQTPARFMAEPDVLYDLDAAASLAGATRRAFLFYCKWGLIRPVELRPWGVWRFTEEAIRTARLGEELRARLGVSLAAVRLILSLMQEVEELRRRVEALERGWARPG